MCILVCALIESFFSILDCRSNPYKRALHCHFVAIEETPMMGMSVLSHFSLQRLFLHWLFPKAKDFAPEIVAFLA
jgi:hypothetical protein